MHRIWLGFAVIMLSACAGVKIEQPGPGNLSAYQDRVTKLKAISDWSFVGKISLDDGDQGGSGRLQWMVDPDGSELDFHGAMGRGAWNLWIGPEHAVLKLANGEEHTAAGVNALIQQQMGWPVPVDALQWWVRGLAAPGPVDEQRLDQSGLLTHLVQFGWGVDFNRYDQNPQLAMPTRLVAERENYRVKLAISNWRIGYGRDAGN